MTRKNLKTHSFPPSSPFRADAASEPPLRAVFHATPHYFCVCAPPEAERGGSGGEGWASRVPRIWQCPYDASDTRGQRAWPGVLAVLFLPHPSSLDDGVLTVSSASVFCLKVYSFHFFIVQVKKKTTRKKKKNYEVVVKESMFWCSRVGIGFREFYVLIL